MSTPHISAEKGDFAKTVLMPGDPLRAKFIADTFLQDVRQVTGVRGMLGFTGTYQGRPISVMGSGMGIPSMTLYAHELYNFFDVDSIIRVGSAGALRDDMKVRDVVIAMSASTNSKFDVQYGFPGTLAPTADFDLLNDAVSVCKEREASVKVGNVFTTDVFYNADSNIPSLCRDLGMLCVEMETAGIYWEAVASHKKALSILSISDHMFRHEELTALERQESFDEMIEIALETAWRSL